MSSEEAVNGEVEHQGEDAEDDMPAPPPPEMTEQEEAAPPAEEAAESTNDTGTSSHLELFVRAGHDGTSYGACPVCQRMFMILLLKANAGELTFTVTTINMAAPPQEFKRLSNRLPVIVHGDDAWSDPDDIVKYIDDRFPYPPLAYDNREANDKVLNLFSKFSFFIKNVSHKPDPLNNELKKLNDYLNKSQHKFLCRDELDHLDCLMLPKLQHIRVAVRDLKGWTIPASYTGLWRYMKNAYDSDVFRQTCPSDQEICNFWIARTGLPVPKRHHSVGDDGKNQEPMYSFDVPTEEES